MGWWQAPQQLPHTIISHGLYIFTPFFTVVYNNNNIFAIVQSTVSGLLKDSNTTVGVKNLLRWGSNRRPLEYKAGVFTIPPRNR